MQEKTGNQNFVYELSCDQMCGKGHTGMRGVVVVESQEEFDRWLASKKPQYYAAFPDKDPTAPKKDSVNAVPAGGISMKATKK